MFHGIMWKFDRSGFMVTWCGYTWDILGYLMGIFNEDMSWALCSPTVSFNSGDDNAPWMEWATGLPGYPIISDRPMWLDQSWIKHDFRLASVKWSKLQQIFRFGPWQGLFEWPVRDDGLGSFGVPFSGKPEKHPNMCHMCHGQKLDYPYWEIVINPVSEGFIGI